MSAALLSVTGLAALAPEASATVRSASWSAGDCFASGDVAKDVIDLTSKVPCSKEHAVQVLSGTKLPDTLAGAGYANLLSTTSSVRAGFAAFANLACGSANVVSAVYPKQGRALAQLLLRHDATEFIPPAPGQLGWALADETSFKAGATDVLCAFTVDKSAYGKSAGDVRQLGTSATLPNFRLCENIDKQNMTSWVSCSKPHVQEVLIYLDQIVTGRPAAVKDWTDTDWAPYDAMCADFAEALVGAERKDLKVIADVANYDALPRNGRRLFMCKAEPPKETDVLGPGSVVGLGKKKLAIQKAKGKS